MENIGVHIMVFLVSGGVGCLTSSIAMKALSTGQKLALIVIGSLLFAGGLYGAIVEGVKQAKRIGYVNN